jgi:hypothetical protein
LRTIGSRIPQRASSSSFVAILAVGMEFIKEKKADAERSKLMDKNG